MSIYATKSAKIMLCYVLVPLVIIKSGFSGESTLNNYQWNKNIAKHYFCTFCGVYTHHLRRRDPSQISINIMCVDDILLPSTIKINQVDGASHD